MSRGQAPAGKLMQAEVERFLGSAEWPAHRPDPTTKGAWLVKGETDVGPQRRCRTCRQFWPLESSCWVTRTNLRYLRRWQRDSPQTVRRRYFLQPCRSCRSEHGLATY